MAKGRFLVMGLSVLALLALLLTVGGMASANTPEPTSLEGEGPAPTPTGLLDDVIMTRTPVPTATPGALQQEVAKLVARAGLARTKVLGLTVTEWLALVGSLLLVLAGYLIGTWLIRRVLRRIVRRTATEFDDQFLKAVGNTTGPGLAALFLLCSGSPE